MNNPQQNIDNINNLIEQVKNHCMCAKFYDQDGYYMVCYPYGFKLDGARASQANGKGIALERLLNAMERHWLEDMPNYKEQK